jgi:hypothetical protein
MSSARSLAHELQSSPSQSDCLRRSSACRDCARGTKVVGGSADEIATLSEMLGDVQENPLCGVLAERLDERLGDVEVILGAPCFVESAINLLLQELVYELVDVLTLLDDGLGVDDAKAFLDIAQAAQELPLLDLGHPGNRRAEEAPTLDGRVLQQLNVGLGNVPEALLDGEADTLRQRHSF